VDRRFGENDPSMDPEQRMMERFAQEVCIASPIPEYTLTQKCADSETDQENIIRSRRR
jgi:hypothetical protein